MLSGEGDEVEKEEERLQVRKYLQRQRGQGREKEAWKEVVKAGAEW